MGGVSLTLSGIFHGEEDVSGLKELLKLLSRYGVLLGAAVGAMLIAFAPVLTGVFIPEEGAAKELTIQGLRLFALGLIPCCINNALKNLYQGTGRVALTEGISVLEGAVFPALAALVLGRLFGVTGVWLYFLCGEVLALLFTVMLVWKKNQGFPRGAKPFLLLREDFGVWEGNLMEVSIRSIEEVTGAAEKAEAFCRAHRQSEKTANHIALCVEEMASNTVQHGFRKDRENHLSVRIQNREKRWTLRFRDDCSAFDPVSYVPRGEEDALGIRLVMAMADDIRYTYSLNLNNLTIKLTDQQV